MTTFNIASRVLKNFSLCLSPGVKSSTRVGVIVSLFTLTFLPLQRGWAQEILVDPTRPIVSGNIAAVKKNPLILQAIYDRKGKKTAVINGKTVRVGDHLGGAKVVNISASSVSVERNGNRDLLSLRAKIR